MMVFEDFGSHCNISEGCQLHLRTENYSVICSFVKSHSDVCEGGGYLSYTQLVFCGHNSVYTWPVFAAFILLLFQYFLALSIAAESFFCPSLAVIVDHLKISQNIAGVTFLAFGNGAPDIFAAIASVLSTKTPKFGLALGALLGAGMFLSTVIVATVTMMRPFDVMRRPAIRDLAFFLLTVAYIFFILYNQQISLGEASAFICLYLVYALVVVVGRYVRMKMMRSSPSTAVMVNDEEEGGSEEHEDEVVGEIQGPSRHPPKRHLRRIDSVVEEANWRYNVFHSGTGTHGNTPHPRNCQRFGEGDFPTRWTETAKKFWAHLWKGMKPFSLSLWKESFWLQKAFILLKSPVLVILRLTIPAVDLESEDHNWSQPLTLVQCILAPLFALVAIGNADYMIHGNFPLWIAVLMAGCLLAFLVFLTSEMDSPPVYHKLLAYGGFLMSVLWIYSLATEVVGIITMIGAISGAPEEILGLTLLAWSNSLGDLVSDISVARQGFPRMAISACFGGPLFNLLLGIGIPFTIATIRKPGHFLPVCFNSLTLVLEAFLIWSLLSSLILLPVSRFHATKPYAAYLLVIYVAFLLVAVLTATGVISIPVPHV